MESHTSNDSILTLGQVDMLIRMNQVPLVGDEFWSGGTIIKGYIAFNYNSTDISLLSNLNNYFIEFYVQRFLSSTLNTLVF